MRVTKVFWSTEERSTIVQRAADLSGNGLSGLPLLRTAIESLPPGRQRSLIALSQAPWFSTMLQDELRRRALEERVASDAAAAVREQMEWFQDWGKAQFARLDRMLPAIELLGDPDRVTRIAEAIDENRTAVQGVEENQRKFIDHYMKTASLVVGLLQTLVAQVESLNTYLGRPINGRL